MKDLLEMWRRFVVSSPVVRQRLSFDNFYQNIIQIGSKSITNETKIAQGTEEEVPKWPKAQGWEEEVPENQLKLEKLAKNKRKEPKAEKV